MDVVRIPLQDAETQRQRLLDLGVVDFTRIPEKDSSYLYIAVTSVPEGFEGVEKVLREKEERPGDLRSALEGILTEEELGMLKTAYDLVGDIAILEIDEPLRTREKLIGETLFGLLPAVDVVVRKAGSHEGELRLQEYVFLAGEERYETTTTENGVRLTLDIRQSYYSVRSATERARIASLVQPGERVLVMFSGIAPFVCVIGKNTEAAEVVGVELNEDAHRYAVQNINQNGLTNAKVLQGDVRDVVPTLGVFDRICMPLPHTAKDFLDVAVPACTTGGMIHLYHFSTEEEVNAFAQTIPVRLEQLGRGGKVEHIQKCGNLGPGIHRWSLDIRIQ